MKTHNLRRSLILAALSVVLFAGADWPRFRGPAGNGVSDDKGLPVTWSATENIVWKTPMPGFGASSPITLGDRVFLTCYSGYGQQQEDPGQQESLSLHVLCIDRASGKILWDRSSEPRLPVADYAGGQVHLHGYASGTPVTDGKAVYAFFGRSGVRAYGLDGEPLWKADVGDKTHSWGSGTSPILAGELLIVNASVESESLVALNKTTGDEVWRVEGIRRSWSTPGLVELADGNQELVVNMEGKLLAVDPVTGEELWECAGMNDYVTSSVISHDGIVYLTGGRRPPSKAVRAGGRGDVTGTHVLWEVRRTANIPTPIYHEGLLFWISHEGITACINADTGELLYGDRLDIPGTGDKVYASPVLADGKVYIVTLEQGTWVLAAGRELKVLAHNQLDDDSTFNATPAISNGQLLLRSDRFLYCIGQ